MSNYERAEGECFADGPGPLARGLVVGIEGLNCHDIDDGDDDGNFRVE